MADAINVFKSRRSCKNFTRKQVSDEVLEAILEAGKHAPSGMNRQSAIMLVARDKELVKKLSHMNAQVMGADTDPFYGAPTVIIVFADKEVPTYKEDGSLVMGNLLNAAHALGLGSCWIHRAKEVFNSAEGKALMKKWGLKDSLEGIGHCILGYGEGPEPAEKPRKDGYVVWAD